MLSLFALALLKQKNMPVSTTILSLDTQPSESISPISIEPSTVINLKLLNEAVDESYESIVKDHKFDNQVKPEDSGSCSQNTLNKSFMDGKLIPTLNINTGESISTNSIGPSTVINLNLLNEAVDDSYDTFIKDLKSDNLIKLENKGSCSQKNLNKNYRDEKMDETMLEIIDLIDEAFEFLDKEEENELNEF